jgi:tRNA modification GTPase
MPLDIQDTIVALASAPGGGARSIIRVTGPEAIQIVGVCFRPALDDTTRRKRQGGSFAVEQLSADLPADAYVWPGARSYTGQPLVEIHTLGAPPLVEAVVSELLARGCRPARPGEFTLRAFLLGKIDLTRAEAVNAVIGAGSRDELQQALAQVAGGLSAPLEALRDDLLNLLADVEAGLDFADEDIAFVRSDELLHRIGAALARVTNLQRQLGERSLANEAYRVLLVGPANAGKSSLFNALTGSNALVSDEPGTTRDYLARQVRWDGLAIELIDTAGWKEAAHSIEEIAARLARDQHRTADLALVCRESGTSEMGMDCWRGLEGSASERIRVATKCDRGPAEKCDVATSAHANTGLETLRRMIAERARAKRPNGVAPSVSRCQNHIDRLLGNLRQAHAAVLFEDAPEIVAAELRAALDEIGEMVGSVYTDDLLDRIFSRFCIGK